MDYLLYFGLIYSRTMCSICSNHRKNEVYGNNDLMNKDKKINSDYKFVIHVKL